MRQIPSLACSRALLLPRWRPRLVNVCMWRALAGWLSGCWLPGLTLAPLVAGVKLTLRLPGGRVLDFVRIE